MDRMMRLKAAAVIVCGSLTCGAFAANGNTTTQQPTVTTTTPANNTQTDNNTMGHHPMGTPHTATMQLSDSAMLAAVQGALVPYKDRVSISVKNGIVYLSGQLDSDTDYEQVVTLTESIHGIGDVNVDKLTVKDSQKPLEDTFLTAKVKGSLIQADIMGKDIPSWSIGVETKNGEVYLSGTVASAQERQAILDVVKSVKGVKKVNDRMELSADSTANNANTADTNAD
ncbi:MULTISPECIES: BON domain-containing protein [unclassified Legionella]|uniref:BON domain-containing protein n=1 Tax=unclassified Legionella TaxID=2622702 RepID=UPI001056DAAF|nr:MULTISPECIES: BON domain-containing protein [unclassified Legionella]MDI9819026.1 BON domain-containing protein [Legionella sp. PL877]